MNWGDFKDTVRGYLLVDSERKGRGVQKYINQLIRSAIIDLQRYVPELSAITIESYRSNDSVSDWSSTKQYAFGDIVTLRDLKINSKFGSKTFQAIRGQDDSITQPPIGDNPDNSVYWTPVNILSPTEEGAHEGNFDNSYALIDRVYIRQFPLSGTNTLEKSKYHTVRQIDWDHRGLLLDGKTPYRTITFGDSGFIYAPQLKKDEKLLIEWKGENHYRDSAYFGGTTKDQEEVVFDDREAKAVAEYTKAHLQREVERDLNMYKSHWTQYQKERQEK